MVRGDILRVEVRLLHLLLRRGRRLGLQLLCCQIAFNTRTRLVLGILVLQLLPRVSWEDELLPQVDGPQVLLAESPYDSSRRHHALREAAHLSWDVHAANLVASREHMGTAGGCLLLSRLLLHPPPPPPEFPVEASRVALGTHQVRELLDRWWAAAPAAVPEWWSVEEVHEVPAKYSWMTCSATAPSQAPAPKKKAAGNTWMLGSDQIPFSGLREPFVLEVQMLVAVDCTPDGTTVAWQSRVCMLDGG